MDAAPHPAVPDSSKYGNGLPAGLSIRDMVGGIFAALFSRAVIAKEGLP
jgi:hypothetical protein